MDPFEDLLWIPLKEPPPKAPNPQASKAQVHEGDRDQLC